MEIGPSLSAAFVGNFVGNVLKEIDGWFFSAELPVEDVQADCQNFVVVAL